MTLSSSLAHENAELALLTGGGAGEVLHDALGPGTVVRSWQVHSIHHRPGAGVSVGYGVLLDDLRADGSVERKEKYLVASTGRLNCAPNVSTVNASGIRVHVWEFPDDPELPGLRTACSPALLSELLGERVSVELLGYRPTRRGVVKVLRADNPVGFGKIVRPEQAAGLVERYRMLPAAPEVIYHDESGIILTQAARGVALANVLSAGLGPRARRMFRALMDCLDQIPAAANDLPHRPAWSDRVEHYAHAAAAVLPDHRELCLDIARRVRELMDVSDPGPITPVHGDFYEANIFVDPQLALVRTLIDVDSLGPGYRVDDVACLLGHVSVLEHLAPASYPRVGTDLPTWVQMAENICDPVALNARCGGVVLSLVAGAKRPGVPGWEVDGLGRLATAQKWVERAEGWR